MKVALVSGLIVKILDVIVVTVVLNVMIHMVTVEKVVEMMVEENLDVVMWMYVSL